jgi:hypothetical protein
VLWRTCERSSCWASRGSASPPSFRGSSLLGHASEEVTDTYYVAKPVLAPDVSEILEQLGADRGADDPEPGYRKSERAA